MDRETIKKIAFYLLLIVIILRFLVIPLNRSLKAKKTLLNEYTETYRTRVVLLEKKRSEQKAKHETIDTKQDLLKSVYEKGTPYTKIQSDFLDKLMKIAEKHGLNVVNFEIPEVAQSKTLSEVPVTIRLKGEPKGLVDLLKDLEKWQEAMQYKSFETSKSGNDFVHTLSVSAFRIEK